MQPNNTLTNILAMQNSTQLVDLTNYTTVAAVTNTYTLDLASKVQKNFAIETADAVAKTIAISNVPVTADTIINVSINLKYTNSATITYPTGTTWQDGAVPAPTVGKSHLLLFTSYNAGVTWLASDIGEW